MSEVETFEQLLAAFNYPLHPSQIGQTEEEKAKLPPFEKILTRVVPEIQKCIDPKTDADCVAIVTSKSYGGGKSTLGALICRATWPEFDIREHSSYTPHQVFKNMGKIPKGGAHQIDEGKRAVGTRMDFRTKKGQLSEIAFSENRQQNQLTVICAGEAHRILGFMTENRVLVWFHILKRGTVMVFKALDFKMMGNSFGIDDKKLKGVKTSSELRRYLRSLPSFCFEDTFPKYHKQFLPRDWFLAYRKKKAVEFQKLLAAMADDKTNIYRTLSGSLIDILHDGELKMSYRKLEDRTGKVCSWLTIRNAHKEYKQSKEDEVGI